MAQTRKRRRTKHRGNAAGMVESRGRTGRKPTSAERRPASVRDEARQRREERASRPPTWRSAAQRAAVSAVAFVVLLLVLFHRNVAAALGLGAFVAIFYVPLGYYTDLFIYRRRMAKKRAGGG
jgi:Flp pilus assembly protein TadB